MHNNLPEGYWLEAAQAAPRIWRITCLVVIVASLMALLADINNLDADHFVPGISIRIGSILYFLVTGILGFFNPEFIKKWHRVLMALTVYIISWTVGILGVWTGGIESLYFAGVIEVEFLAAMFFPIPRKTLTAAIIASNLFCLAALIYLGGAPIDNKFLNVFLTLAICGMVAVVAHHIVLSYKERAFLQRQQLAESQRKIANILSSITDAFFALDNDWRFTYFNHEAERLLSTMQRRKEDLLGNSIWETFPGLFQSTLREKLSRARQEGVPVSFDEYYPPLKAYMEVHAYPSPEGLSVYLNDVSDRKRAEEALQKSHEQLEQRVVERTSELQRLTAHQESVREDERTRISREIHDELGQTLTVLKMELSWLNKHLDPKNKTTTKTLHTMSDLVDETFRGVRQIAAELRPGILDDLGLAAAVEWLTDKVRERTGIKFTRIIEPDDILLNPDCSTALFRIVQEALTNIVRHANATHIHVRLQQTDSAILLDIEDNGVGMDLKTATDNRKADGLGLVGMRERIRQLDGQVSITSIRGSGTTVAVRIPYKLSAERAEP